MSLNVIPFNSGTQAIQAFLEEAKIDTVLLPNNICPDVIRSLTKRYNLVLCEIEDHFKPPNYHKYISSNLGEVAIIFVHTYGVYQQKDREQISNSSVKLVIDDCCLCDPISIINNYFSYDRNYVFSFGYSKFIDLNGGGLYLGEHDLNTSTTSINGINLPLEHIKFSTIEQFKKSEIYKIIDLYSRNRSEHSRKLSDIYVVLDEFFETMDSPWRKIYKVNKKFLDNLKETIDRENPNLFFGTNYPLWQYKNGNLSKKDSVDFSDKTLINLFNDFRVDEQHATDMVEVIKSLLGK